MFSGYIPLALFNLSHFLKQLLFIFLIQSFVWAPQIKLLSPSFIGSINLVCIDNENLVFCLMILSNQQLFLWNESGQRLH